MNTGEIQDHLRDLSGFLGVFPSDTIPPLKLRVKPQCLIINLDPAHKPGSHWVAACLYLEKSRKTLEFFDSYGLKPPSTSIGDWKVIHNPWMFQAPRTKVCGHYCIYFVRHRLKGVSFKTIITQLRRQKSPDRSVLRYVTSLTSSKRCCKKRKCPGGKTQICKAAPTRKKLTRCKKVCLWTLREVCDEPLRGLRTER